MELIETRKKNGIVWIGFVSGWFSIVVSICHCDYHAEDESAGLAVWRGSHSRLPDIALSDQILITHLDF